MTTGRVNETGVLHDPVDETDAADCANCGCPRVEAFCPACGQERISPVQPLREVVADTAGEFFKWDSKLVKTVTPLVSKPGFLTVEYLRGRRVPYISPVRLYLWVSALYFFFFAFGPQKQLEQAFTQSAMTAQSAPTSATTVTVVPTPTPSVSARATSGQARPDREAIKERLTRRLASGGKWYAENISTVGIFLVPVFAAVTGIIQWRLRRVYIEHLIFTLHNQTFGFLLSLVTVPLTGGITSLGSAIVLPTALLIYIYLALRRIYGQSPVISAVKAILIVAAQYLASMLMGIVSIIVYLFWPG